ncbi:MAG TPA: phage tail sheath subtilisin-like domain-containing protein [Solirubrobacteraceae bacterium]|nr:phage tail sheath subtilisin-like domain-containing protein [Solirubrobacteraceae bacterium]
MPEYLAPGVYVEEVSYRSNVIIGAGTTTTGFVGPTRFGPVLDQPDILTSLSDYEQVYGDGQQLVFDGTETFDNYMWQAVRAFFTEGGATLYVKRIYSGDLAGGTASGTIGAGIPVSARYPGAYGEIQVSFTLAAGQNVAAKRSDPVLGTVPAVRGLNEYDVVLVGQDLGSSPPASPPAGAIFPVGSPPSLGSPPAEQSFVAGRYDASGNLVTYVDYTFASAQLVLDPSSGNQVWQFLPAGGAPSIPLSALSPASTTDGPGDTVQIVTLTLSATAPTNGALPQVWSGLPLDPLHNLNGALDSVGAVFAPVLAPGTAAPPLVFDVTGYPTGLGVLYALGDAIDLVGLSNPTTTSGELTATITLQGGNDGGLPNAADYTGAADPVTDAKTGLVAFEDLTDISIVAAPGSTATYTSNTDEVHAIINALITHAETMQYRIAVVDAGKDQTISQVRAMRGQFDSSWAAFYYPWVTILDPITNQPNNMPPSGFVSGIYVRNDFNRAVYKAPANEVVNLAIGFERPINKSQQEILNPEGINCFRFFEGRGYRLWGARLMSSDPEWLYVNLRRYFAFLEQSIDQSTQWAVFEPNGPVLWLNIQSTVNDFLFDQWQQGALLGDKSTDAYFVRCDQSTMTQNDIDNGRMVCLIGVAVVRPAEFVIFRIGQWTADSSQ